MVKYKKLKQRKRYGLNDMIQLKMNQQLHYKKLSDWINLYPDILYYHLYLPGKLELVKIYITHPAYIEFKKKLAKMFPDLFKQMIIKQLNAKATLPVHFH